MRKRLLLAGIPLVLACASSPRDGFNGDPPGPGFGASPDGGSEEDPSCVASVAPTTKSAVDIIFVIDNSSSMKEETAQVQANINAFAGKIGQRGYDSNIIFVVNKTLGPPAQPFSKICVPEPLAGPNCTDNPPRFHHIDYSVFSPMRSIIETFDSDKPSLAWNAYLRRDAFKVFVGVSDDAAADLAAADFDGKLLAKPGAQFGSAARRNYVFHAICGWKEGTPHLSSERCSTADSEGLPEQNIALLTGGRIESVCKTDYSSVLDNIGDGIVDRLACELAYPTSQATDPSKVQVRLTATDQPAKLVQVTDASKCAANPRGWFYDDPSKPTRIVLCDGACTDANAVVGAKVEALVGCPGPAPR